MNQNSKIFVDRAYFSFKTFVTFLPSNLIFDFNPYIFFKKCIKCDGKLITTNMSFQNSAAKFITYCPKWKRTPRHHPKQCVPFVQSNCARHTFKFLSIWNFQVLLCPKKVLTSSSTAQPIPFTTSTSDSAQKFRIFVFIIFFRLTLCPIYSSKF